jgi:SulP family sulfate permease
VNVIILEMNRVPYLDQSAAHALELVFDYLKKQGITVYLAHVRENPLKMLHNVDLVPRVIPKEHIFDHIFDCIKSLEEEFVFKVSKKNSDGQKV